MRLVELIAASAVQVMGIVSPTLGAVGNVGLYAWHESLLEKFRQRIEYQSKSMDQRKLDRAALQSDEFHELVLQIVRSASECSSEVKRKVFASALLNSVYLPTSSYHGKQMLLRVLQQLSPEEIMCLTALVEARGSHADNPDNPRAWQDVFEDELIGLLPWETESVTVTLEGLRQLGLIWDPMVGTWHDGKGQRWALTHLAEQLIAWCSGGEQ